MTREEAINIVQALPTGLHEQTDADKKNIRAIVEAFGVEGVNLRGRCPSCWQDAVMVLRNFFGISGGDTDGDGEPDTSGKKWKYLRKTAMRWRGNIIDADTPDSIVEEFVQYHPQFFEEVKHSDDGGNGGEEEA